MIPASSPAAGQRAAVAGTLAIKLWAAMGAAWLLFSFSIWARWMLSPEFGPTPTGVDPVPHWLYLWTHTFEALSTGMWCACLYCWAIRPWRRTGKMSWDGLYILAGALTRLQCRDGGGSTLKRMVCCFIFFALLDLVLEGGFASSGLYAFASTIPAATLFAGKPYQFPLYETIWMGLMWCSYTFFRHFRDHRGFSVVERGADSLRVSDRGRTWVRWLALVGAVQVILFLTYNLPIQWSATRGGAFPPYPSYLINGVCGYDTPYTCGGIEAAKGRIGSPR